MLSVRAERPADEMKRRIRLIAGRAQAGEKDDQLRARAARRMNAGLEGDQHIGARRAKAYWYGEIAEVPSHHMDRVRELTLLHPLEELHDALERAEHFLEGLRSRLADAHAPLRPRLPPVSAVGRKPHHEREALGLAR